MQSPSPPTDDRTSHPLIWSAGAIGILVLLIQVLLHFDWHGLGASVRLGDFLVGLIFHEAARRAIRDMRRRDLDPAPISLDIWASRVFMAVVAFHAVLAVGFSAYPPGTAAFSALGKAVLFLLAVRLRGRVRSGAHGLDKGHGVVLSPAATVVGSFLIAIAMGWLLLSIPEASRTGRPLSVLDTLFTATSATCVTGLIVKDTPNDFSLLGHLVILALVQTGGLGIMTLATAFGVARGRRLRLHDRMIVRDTLVLQDPHDFARSLGSIALFTFTVEAVGAILLYLRWLMGGEAPLRAAWLAVFHSISAFCNAGFSLFSNSLEDYSADLPVNLIIGGLIIVGGIGFPVAFDIWQYLGEKRRGRRARLTLHSRLALSTTAHLLLVGFLGLWLLEWTNTLLPRGLSESVCATGFQALTPRTAGFNTLPIGALTDAAKFLIIMLMFIGASPGSTGGGIKTCTFAVVACIARAMIRNDSRVQALGRAIPESVRHRAVAILILFGISVLLLTFALSISERSEFDAFIDLLFESVSAFGTVGLSTGITPHLSTFGRLAIIVAMLMGRIGPLTVALAMVGRRRGVELAYPEETVMVG